MKARVENDLDDFESAYGQIVEGSAATAAKLILDRNGQLLLEVAGTRSVIDFLEDKVMKEILETKQRDGLILSDRVWRISQEAKRDITNRVTQGILLGESHTRVAKDIKQYVVGTGGLRYKANRLAITEFSRAYKTANELSVEAMRQDSEFMWFEKWELSPAHRKVDVCDLLASQDPEGEGRGVYRRAPNRHPGCYCYIYPVYREKRTTKTYGNVSGVTPNPTEATSGDHRLANQLTL